MDEEVSARALSERIAALSPEQRALFERRMKQKAAPVPMLRARPRTGGVNSFPLSYAQERLWFLDQLTPASSHYNESRPFRLHGTLDIDALKRSFEEVVRRHETLRTTFAVVEGQHRQVVAPSLVLALPVFDLGHLARAQAAQEARRLAFEEARRPFDLAEAVLRIMLLRLDAEEHLLVVSMHHIACDGWSMGVFIGEVKELYKAYAGGGSSSPQLPELPLQYADYAMWQREWLTGDALEEQLGYWRRQLSGSPPVLELPADHARPPVQSLRGARLQLSLPPSLGAQLKSLAQREGVSLFMTLLAAFQILIYRYTKQTDIVVGTPVANRHRREIEGLIGCFVNTLVLRTDVSGNPRIRELLGRVRDTSLGAYAHQDVPFERLVEELQPERDMSSSPLFQVMFALENAPMPALEMAGLTMRAEPVDNETAKFDLVLSMIDTAHGLAGYLEYSTDLFERATVARLAGHFQNILESIAADAEQRLTEVPLLSQAERQQLDEWNSTRSASSPPSEQCLHQFFETQAAKTPDDIALVFEDEQWTYRDLDGRANQLAHYLRRVGVGREVLVGIMLERSSDIIVACLGVLKAGGAYVPLDPAYPPERLSNMMQDACFKIVLTQRRLRHALLAGQTEIFCMDKDWSVVARARDDAAPSSGVSPDNPAYVIYTSGSTGKPKGIAMPHRPVANLVAWQLRQHDLARKCRTLQFASINFDIFLQECFTTWAAGGTLVLMREEVRRDTESLLRFIAERAIERLFLPFVVLQQLAEVAGDDSPLPRHLREVVTAGEQLRATRHVRDFFKKLPGATLHNHYGPSECHVVTTHTLDATPDDWPALPPIGRPIDNVDVHLLDDDLQPVPVGITGELHIGGVALARGYLHQPELTAERFIPHPLSDEAGARLYRTGDLARRRTNGAIEYVGRADTQVKVRGYRVELGEIEAVLGRHPSVQECVVTAWAGKDGNQSLAAYLVAAPGQSFPSTRQWRAHLKQTLPDYMLPDAFVALDVLPLDPNGKLDRRALPAPEMNATEAGGAFVAPRNEVEEVLVDIWREVLGLKRVSVEDSFFSLGGHSLMVTQVLSRVRDAFQMHVPLRSLFESPTVASQAATLAAREGTPGRVLAVARLHRQLALMSDDEIEATLLREKHAADASSRPSPPSVNGKNSS